MTRRCDNPNCAKIIPLGSDHIEVRFIGDEEGQKLFGTAHLDFCSLKCLIVFWSNQQKKEKKQ